MFHWDSNKNCPFCGGEPEKLDVEALKKSDRRVDYPNGLSEQGAGRILGWNDCIDHLAANYDFVRKV